jgi:uncharacterized protein (DUF885 family)
MISSLNRRLMIAGIGAAAAAGPALTGAATTAEGRFQSLVRRWLAGTLRLNPVAATQIGDHRFDSALDDMGPPARAARDAFSQGVLAALARIPRRRLSRASQVDAALLENSLRYDLWTSQTLQDWAWDPLIYNELAGDALYGLMAREYAPEKVRLRAAAARMEALPALLAQARANLVPARVPRVHADTWAKQNKGVLDLVDELILPQANALPAADRARLHAAAEHLRTAIMAHQDWIERTLVPNAHGDFRLGATLYDAKLAFALNSTLSRQEIRRRAEAAVAAKRDEMYVLARQVLKDRPGAPVAPEHPDDAQRQAVIEAALELAYADRPARDQVVAAATAALAQATDFVRAKDLVTLPSAPVKVALMAAFRRGVSVADCDSPGPLDRSQSTIFEVSPIPADWTPAQADSFLREYNRRAIHEIAIHEAMPGHYVQLWHANTYPSVLRAVLQSNAFIEGWAMYGEDVMAEAGYLGGDPLYRLTHLKIELRAVVNAILDQAVHVDGMSHDDAMKLLTVTAFQQNSEAEGKWTRVSVTSAQLPTYFVGYSEHWQLRRDAEARQGAAFNLKRHHDAVLSFGSPPVRFARQMMFGEEVA